MQLYAIHLIWQVSKLNNKTANFTNAKRKVSVVFFINSVLPFREWKDISLKSLGLIDMTYKNNYIKPLSFKCCHVSLGGFWLWQRWKIDRADIVFKAYLGNGNHVRKLIWNYSVDMSTRFNHVGSRQHTRGATDGLGCSAKIQIRSKHARGCSKALMSLNTAAR